MCKIHSEPNHKLHLPGVYLVTMPHYNSHYVVGIHRLCYNGNFEKPQYQLLNPIYMYCWIKLLVK